MKNEHDKNCGEIACGTRGKTCKSKTNLIPHEAKHARDFVCTSCDKLSNSVKAFTSHGAAQ